MNPAYAYIYDDFLADPRYQEVLDALETQLATLGLDGRIGRLTLFRNAKELVEDFVAQGVKNIVAVGNDNTLDKLMWFLPELSVTMGYIPLVEPSGMARLLNIPTGVAACEVLGARLIETLDMGKINDRYFLSEVVFENCTASLFVDQTYRLTLTHGGTLAIRNLGGFGGLHSHLADAQDGMLEAVLTPSGFNLKTRFWNKLKVPTDQETRVVLKMGQIVSGQPMAGQADHYAISGFRFDVTVEPKKLRVIMGRRFKVSL